MSQRFRTASFAQSVDWKRIDDSSEEVVWRLLLLAVLGSSDWWFESFKQNRYDALICEAIESFDDQRDLPIAYFKTVCHFGGDYFNVRAACSIKQHRLDQSQIRQNP
jgi:hypothetical protein